MSEHELWLVGATTHSKEMVPHEAGGQVARFTLLPIARWTFRYYCECGTVGGKRATPQQAEASHAAHAASMKEVAQ